MMNCINLMGRICEAPELKTTQSGISVLSLNVAVERSIKAKDGSRLTDFIPVVFWRGAAEIVSKYFKKGDMIGITGELQTRKYEDKSGANRTAFEVIANNVYFTGSKREQDKSEAPKDYSEAPGNFVEIAPNEPLPF